MGVQAVLIEEFTETALIGTVLQFGKLFPSKDLSDHNILKKLHWREKILLDRGILKFEDGF